MHAWITETYSSWIVQLAVVFGLLVGSFFKCSDLSYSCYDGTRMDCFRKDTSKYCFN